MPCIPALGFDVVAECGHNVFGGKHAAGSERAEDVRCRRECIPVLEGESDVFPYSRGYRLTGEA